MGGSGAGATAAETASGGHPHPAPPHVRPRRRLRDALSEDRFPITFEVRSIPSWDIEPAIEELVAIGLHDKIAAINITNNPTARVMIDPNAYGYQVLRDTKYRDVVLHATCRDHTIAGMQSWLLGVAANGITNITVMSGDHPRTGDYPRAKRVDDFNVIELITGMREYLNKGLLMPELTEDAVPGANRLDPPLRRLEAPTDFFPGSVVLPARNQEAPYAARKRDSGANYFQTQLSYDAKILTEFFDDIMEQGLAVLHDVPYLIGVSPVTGRGLLKFLDEDLPGCKVLPATKKRLLGAHARGGGEAMAKESVQVALELFGTVLDHNKERGYPFHLGGHVLPIHSYEYGTQIVEGLRAMTGAVRG